MRSYHLDEGNTLAVYCLARTSGEPASFPTGVKVIMTSFAFWDCQGAGVAVRPGDVVDIIVHGSAE